MRPIQRKWSQRAWLLTRRGGDVVVMTHTHVCVTYFNKDTVDDLQRQVTALERDLDRRAPFILGENYAEALDRLEAVRLTVKRLSDVVPE